MPGWIQLTVHFSAAAIQQELFDNPLEVASLRLDEIIQAIQDAGMVGLGGAAFPTHVKMKPPSEHCVDTLVVNSCECEPYLTCDHRVMLEQAEQLIAGIRIVMHALDVKRAINGSEDNKLNAVEKITALLPPGDSISVQAVRTKYPQGAEKMLIESLLGRRVPPGSFPSAVGVSVLMLEPWHRSVNYCLMDAALSSAL